jgi:hypothetical protein|tara:strand:+ start:141 stop:281 length:141 start_codon:yes stop_codon:yes gene_type:complete
VWLNLKGMECGLLNKERWPVLIRQAVNKKGIALIQQFLIQKEFKAL